MGRKIHKILILLLSVLLCTAATSCLSILSTIKKVYNNALDTGKIGDREEYYGDENVIGVTFENGEMYAEWDVAEGVNYSLEINDGKEIKTFDGADEGFETGKSSLTKFGYDFWQDLKVSLNTAKNTGSGRTINVESYSYKGIDAKTYDNYTKTVKAGFKDIDYYMGNRSEWFDFWSYLIIFREGATIDSGCYELSANVYMGYDYASYYHSKNIEKAFANEVYSAIDAYEDSAAYTYSFEVDETGKYGTIYMKFLYDFDPKYSTITNEKYKNALDKDNPAHYNLAAKPKERKFAIDEVADTISPSSSDQLYYTLKKGYKPTPVSGSNAEYLYSNMRNILSRIVSDKDKPVQKVHSIYDYIIDTVIYDYEFTDNVYEDEGKGVGELFSYRCMYMEGVFGLGDNGVINDKSRVAICDGLSKAFLSMATIEGIDALKISGTVNDEGHAWNKVKIDGTWYMIDTTWGNSLEEKTNDEYLNHHYLLVADDTSHKETPYISYPKASVAYNFGGEVDNSPEGSNNNIRPWFPGFPKFPQFSA